MANSIDFILRFFLNVLMDDHEEDEGTQSGCLLTGCGVSEYNAARDI
jgi:hypothetical protein